MRIKELSYATQLSILKSGYIGSSSHMDSSGFVWTCPVKPTALSNIYTIKINYHVGKFPKCYIINPKKLPLAEGATRLPHTYDSQKQQLCLFYPYYREWDSTKPIAITIVHWAIQWLFFYEIWVFTGKWNGGGHGNWDAEPL